MPVLKDIKHIEFYIILKNIFNECEPEYRFHPVRRWRADFAVPSRKILVEVEGGAWTNGRHTRGKGYTGDMEKYNSAQLLGYQVYRYTPQQAAECVRDMEALKKIK